MKGRRPQPQALRAFVSHYHCLILQKLEESSVQSLRLHCSAHSLSLFHFFPMFGKIARFGQICKAVHLGACTAPYRKVAADKLPAHGGGCLPVSMLAVGLVTVLFYCK